MESRYFLRGIGSRYESLATSSATFDATVSRIFHYAASFVAITNNEEGRRRERCGRTAKRGDTVARDGEG